MEFGHECPGGAGGSNAQHGGVTQERDGEKTTMAGARGGKRASERRRHERRCDQRLAAGAALPSGRTRRPLPAGCTRGAEYSAS